MLVDDVVPDAGVHRHRHAQPVCGGEDAQVLVRIIARRDAPADVLARGRDDSRGRLADPVVQLAGLPPQAELAGRGYSGATLSVVAPMRASS